MTGTIGPWQVLIMILALAAWIVPFWKIFPRAGWPSALSLLMVVPLLGFVMLWVLAFKRWPGDAGYGPETEEPTEFG